MRYKSYIASTTSKDDPRFKDLYLFHGKSAYQAAVEMGYKGTEEEWIDSLTELRWGSLADFEVLPSSHKQRGIAYFDTIAGKIYKYDEESQKFVDTEISTYDKEGNPIHSTFLKRSGGIMTGENPLLFESSEDTSYASNHIRFNTGNDRIGADRFGNLGMFASGNSIQFRVNHNDASRGTFMDKDSFRPIINNEMLLGTGTMQWSNIWSLGISGNIGTSGSGWGVRSGIDDTGAAYAELFTKDGGNEPIYARQYKAGSILHEVKLLDENGDTYLPNHLTVAKNVSVNGSLSVIDAAILKKTLNVSGKTTLSDALSGTSASFSSTLSVTGATTLKSTLAVTGKTTLSDTLSGTSASFSSTLSVTGATTLKSTLDVTGDTTLTGALAANGGLTSTDGSFSKTLSVTGATTLKSTLAVTGKTTLSGALAANGGLTSTSGSFSTTLTVAGATTLKSTLAVTGKTTLSGALAGTSATFSTTLDVTGATTLKSTLAVTGKTTLSGALAANGGLTSTSGSFSSTLSVTGATTLKSTLAVTGKTTLSDTLSGTSAIFSGALTAAGATINGNIMMMGEEEDRWIQFSATSSNSPGHGFRIGYMGSGSGNTNYFSLEGGGTGTEWLTALRFGAETFDAEFAGHVLPLVNNSKNLGSSSMKWAKAYATTFYGALSGNASSATKLKTGRYINVGTAVTSTKQLFDGSADIEIPISAIDPSYITQNASYRLVKDTQIAAWDAKPTQAEMSQAIADLINGSPELLDTLDEIAAALGDDPNFATTIATELGKKYDKAGGAISGNVSIGGTLAVTGKTTLSGALAANGGLTSTSGSFSTTLSVTGATTLKSTLAVTGKTTLSGALAANGGLTSTSGSFSKTLTVTGATTLKSTLDVTGDTTLTGALAANGGLTSTSGSFSTTLDVTGATTLKSTLAVTGKTTLSDALSGTSASFSSTLTVTGATTLKSTLAVTGKTTLTGALAANGGLTSTSGSFSTTLTVTGATTLKSTLDVTGKTTLTGALAGTSATFSTTLDVTGATTLKSTLAVTGKTTLAALSGTSASFSGALSAASGTFSGDIVMLGTNVDRWIQFTAEGNVSSPAHSFKLGYVGSGSGNTNYFQLMGGQTGTTWLTALRFGAETFDAEFGGSILPLVNNSKNIGSSSMKWANVYATTFRGNATSASKLATARSIGLNGTLTGSADFDGASNITIDTKPKNLTYAHYDTQSTSSGYIRIKINSKTSWMLSFVLRVYQGYRATDIIISGYNYGSSYWYSPNARILGECGNGVGSDINVTFGYDGAYDLWVAIPAGDYTGCDITQVTNGYTQIGDFSSLFTITTVSSLSGTVQKTINAKPPWYKDENVAAYSATTLTSNITVNGTAFNAGTNSRTKYWGNARNITIGNSKQTVDGTADITWSLADIGAAPEHTHPYLATTGGTVTGATTFSNTVTVSKRLTANGKLTIPTSGGSWISGMTLSNCSIQVSTQNSASSYHPILGGKTYNGHYWNIGSITDKVGFYGFKSGRTENATDWKAEWDVTTGNFTNTGTITGSKVFNATWNDYAEWYEREDTEEVFEAGDIVTWSEDGVVKTTEAFDPCVVGVYSDTYGHIVGGEWLDNMEDNIATHVPVGLCGRVHVKVVGKANRGDLIVSSDIPGVGMAISPKDAYPGVVIGKVLKKKETEEIEKIKIQIMLQ